MSNTIKFSVIQLPQFYINTTDHIDPRHCPLLLCTFLWEIDYSDVKINRIIDATQFDKPTLGVIQALHKLAGKSQFFSLKPISANEVTMCHLPFREISKVSITSLQNSTGLYLTYNSPFH